MRALNRRHYLLGLGMALLTTACVSPSREPGTDRTANAKAEMAPHDHATPMAEIYTCPMHPQVAQNAPGRCPICGMTLIKKESAVPER